MRGRPGGGPRARARRPRGRAPARAPTSRQVGRAGGRSALRQPLRQLPHPLRPEHGGQVRGAAAGGGQDGPVEPLAERLGQLAAARQVAVVGVQRAAAALARIDARVGTSARAARLTAGNIARSKHPSMSCGPAPSVARPARAGAAGRAPARATAGRPPTAAARAPGGAAPYGRGPRVVAPLLEQRAVLDARRADRLAGPAAEAERGLLLHRRVVVGQRAGLERAHQVDPAARRGRLDARARVGRARGQAEAARDAAVQQLRGEDAAPGRRHEPSLPGLRMPCGSKACLIRRSSATCSAPRRCSRNGQLGQADAVLARDRAAELDRGGEDLGEGAVGALDAVVVVGVGQHDRSGAGCRRRRARSVPMRRSWRAAACSMRSTIGRDLRARDGASSSSVTRPRRDSEGRAARRASRIRCASASSLATWTSSAPSASHAARSARRRGRPARGRRPGRRSAARRRRAAARSRRSPPRSRCTSRRGTRASPAGPPRAARATRPGRRRPASRSRPGRRARRAARARA